MDSREKQIPTEVEEYETIETIEADQEGEEYEEEVEQEEVVEQEAEVEEETVEEEVEVVADEEAAQIPAEMIGEYIEHEVVEEEVEIVPISKMNIAPELMMMLQGALNDPSTLPQKLQLFINTLSVRLTTISQSERVLYTRQLIDMLREQAKNVNGEQSNKVRYESIHNALGPLLEKGSHSHKEVADQILKDVMNTAPTAAAPKFTIQPS